MFPEITLLNEVNNEPDTNLDNLLNVIDQDDREWLSNGFNAAAAYKTLHPGVSNDSARVLGTKVSKS